MDEPKKDGPESFRTWLETTTQLSPITIRNYYFVVKKLLLNNGKPSIEEINTFIVQHTRGKTNSTMVHAACLKWLDWKGRDKEMRSVVRGKDIGRKHLESDITLDKLKLLLPHFSGLHKDVFLIQFYTGCREIEALLIEKENVRFDEAHCEILVTKKGGRSHKIFLPLVPAQAIFGKPEYQTRKYVFLKEKYQDLDRYIIMRDAYGNITKPYLVAWQRACIAAGLDAYASHDARRALIRAINDRHGLITAQKLAGHARTDTTMRYLSSDGIDVLKAVKDVMDDE